MGLTWGGGQLIVHVLDCGITDESWAEYEVMIKRVAKKACVDVEVVRHIIDMRRFANFKTWTNGSKAAWARFLIPTLLADVDVCLYSDCDMLFVANPREVLDSLKDSNMLLVGHRDPSAETCADVEWYRRKEMPWDVEKYICSGLIVMNVKAFREEGIEKKCFEFVEQNPDVPIVDQTTLNQVCRGRIGLLADGWGLFTHECHAFDGRIRAIHFAGGWPWIRGKKCWHALSLSLSKEECLLWRDFESCILGLSPSVATYPSMGHRVLAFGALIAARVANRFGVGIGFGGLQRCVAEYDCHTSALGEARREIFENM